MFPSNDNVSRRTTKGAQKHPEGPLVNVDPAVRSAAREEREKRGWRQEDLAAKAKVAPATISNFEGTRSKQIRFVVYARIMRALKMPEPTLHEEATAAMYEQLLEALPTLDADGLATVLAVASSLKKRTAAK